MKRATTIHQQIELLRERGMQLSDIPLAEDFLLNVGYYRLGFYWFHFEKNNAQSKRTHQFRDGISFEQIVELYKFDKNLRNLLICYLNDIEFTIKTRIIYFVSNSNPNTPTWFMDKRVVSAHVRNHIEQNYSELRKNNVIERHHKRHSNDLYAPAWKTIEFFTFGDLCALYSGLLDRSLKQKIAQSLGVRNERMMEHYLRALRRMRNACAHGHNAYDIHLPKGIPTNGPVSIPTTMVHNIGAITRLIQFFLEQMNRSEQPSFSIKLDSLVQCQSDFIKTHIQPFGL